MVRKTINLHQDKELTTPIVEEEISNSISSTKYLEHSLEGAMPDSTKITIKSTRHFI
jgi:hypothetical protein